MEGTRVEETCLSSPSYTPEEPTYDATSRKRSASSDPNIYPEPPTKRLRLSNESSQSSFPGGIRSSTIDDDSGLPTPYKTNVKVDDEEEEEEEGDDDEDDECPTCYSVGTIKEEGCAFCTTYGTVLLLYQRSPLVEDNIFYYEDVMSVEGWVNRVAGEILVDVEEDEEEEEVGASGTQGQADAVAHASEVLRAEAALLHAEAKSKEAQAEVLDARLRLQALQRV